MNQMNQRITSYIILAIIIILLVAGGVWYWMSRNNQVNVNVQDNGQNQQQSDESAQVKSVVVNFGLQLKNISLLGTKVQISAGLDQYYKPYVTPELLAVWKTDTSKAPGRLTSSPWPDRIEISSADKNANGTYTVKGNIIEVTSVEAGTNNAADTIPVTVMLEKRGDAWLISTFTQQIVAASGKASKDDLISVDVPLINATISSPLVISGKARGNWYFEASFPVKLLDGNGNQIAVKPAQAQGDWMTTDYVPFTVTLTFTKPATATGTLVLKKDNPSGLPANDNELRIPVKFQ